MRLLHVTKQLIKFIMDSNYRFLFLASKGLYDNLADEEYIKRTFYANFGYELNLCNPLTFNEKLQWLKLYNRNQKYVRMVDKYQVKQYISETLGEQYLIPTVAVWNDVNDISWDDLPEKFVIKVTHDSGGLVICKDKTQLDIKAAKKKIARSMMHNYYLENREWPYKNVPRRIIAEEYMEDSDTHELRDYKFFCFNGCVKIFKIDFNRQTKHQANYYDSDGNLLSLGELAFPPDFNKKLDLPQNLEKMIELAEKLSKGIPFLRVDFYEVNGRIYFGELTFFPAAGMGKFTSPEWDRKMGSWIELPPKGDER